MDQSGKNVASDRDLDEVIKSVLSAGKGKSPTELKRECLKRIAKSGQTYHRHLKKLIERGDIEKVGTSYRLPLESRVKGVIENLRFRLFRDPSVREVAREIGETPEKTRELIWRLIPETGWREPSKEQISLAEMKLHEIYEMATLLEHFDETPVKNRCRDVPEFRASLRDEMLQRILNRAKYALKHERDKLPTVRLVKENDRQIELDHTWPVRKESNWQWGDSSETYDKTTKSFSGAFTGERQIKIVYPSKEEMEKHESLLKAFLAEEKKSKSKTPVV